MSAPAMGTVTMIPWKTVLFILIIFKTISRINDKNNCNDADGCAICNLIAVSKAAVC